MVKGKGGQQGKNERSGPLSLTPLSLEDALRGAMQVDPAKVKAEEAREKAEKKKRRKK